MISRQWRALATLSTMELATGTMVTTNVRLVKPMARGGMGSVWLAQHLGLDARVAVKFMSSELVGREPSLRERFKREASIGARLRSVHVVQTFDHGVMSDGTPYIVMELLQGQTFTDMVEARGHLSPRQVGVIVAQVAKVLHRAHELRIVHRDIKPDNLFIVEDDYELFVKVLDFGIAKSTVDNDEVITKTGAIVGSPEFMSPEQAINSKGVDHRTDLYSLAVVAYYALTGALPFNEDSEQPFWIQLSSGDHIAASTRMPTLPVCLDAWFDKALAPKPQDRFQTARELSEALARLVETSGTGPVSTLATSGDAYRLAPEDELESAFSEQDTMRIVPLRELPSAPSASSPQTSSAPPVATSSARPTASGPSALASSLRAEIGSAPTMHAAASGSSAPRSVPSLVPPHHGHPPSSIPGAGNGIELPPWSQVSVPKRRPVWLAIVASCAAIAIVLAAVWFLSSR